MIEFNKIEDADIGDLVYFECEKRPYRVKARGKRYAICIKPFNARRTVLYTIIDMAEKVRGPDNMIFGRGYETASDVSERMGELERGEMEVSYRHRIALDFVKGKRNR